MDKRLAFFFNRGMAIPLLLPKLELPGILDALEAHLVVAPEQIELWNSLVREHHYLKNANLVGELNKGWAVNGSLLGLERVYVGLPKHSAHGLARLHDLMTLTDAWDDAAAVDRFTQLQLDLEKYNAQYPPVEIVSFADAHDRFLILDDTEVYHIGASLKDLGKKWFAFSKIEKDALRVIERLPAKRVKEI